MVSFPVNFETNYFLKKKKGLTSILFYESKHSKTPTHPKANPQRSRFWLSSFLLPPSADHAFGCLCWSVALQKIWYYICCGIICPVCQQLPDPWVVLWCCVLTLSIPLAIKAVVLLVSWFGSVLGVIPRGPSYSLLLQLFKGFGKHSITVLHFCLKYWDVESGSFFFFWLHHVLDLRPTRDWTCAPCRGSSVLTTGLPGNSKCLFFFSYCKLADMGI